MIAAVKPAVAVASAHAMMATCQSISRLEAMILPGVLAPIQMSIIAPWLSLLV